MKYYDLVRVEPDEEMRRIAGVWGDTLLHRVKGVLISRDISEAKRGVTRYRAIFIDRVDAALLSLAKQNGVFLGFFTSDIDERSLERYMEWVRLVRRAGVPIVIASGARSVYEMRSPRDRAMIGVLLGMSREDAFSAVSKRWGEIVEAP